MFSPPLHMERQHANMEGRSDFIGADTSSLINTPCYSVGFVAFPSYLGWTSLCGWIFLQADIVGRRLGAKHKLPWNSSKSWAGSGAMFLGGCLHLFLNPNKDSTFK